MLNTIVVPAEPVGARYYHFLSRFSRQWRLLCEILRILPAQSGRIIQYGNQRSHVRRGQIAIFKLERQCSHCHAPIHCMTHTARIAILR